MYKVIILHRAEKEIRKLPQKQKQKVMQSLKQLSDNPFTGKKLDGDYDGYYAIRVWPYRVIYAISRKTITMTVVRVGHRKNVYKRN